MDIMAQHLAHMRARRAVPEARLPAPRRHVRAARARRARSSSRSSRACSATTPTSCAASSTCASTSRRPRSCAASGRCSATARAAATRPTRCSPSSTGASPTPRRSSGRSSSTPTSSSRSCRARRRPGAPRRRARAAPDAHASRLPLGARRRGDATGGIKLTERDGEAHLLIPGTARPRAGRGDRGDDLGAACTSRATCAPSGSASSRSAPTCTARSRSR